MLQLRRFGEPILSGWRCQAERVLNEIHNRYRYPLTMKDDNNSEDSTGKRASSNSADPGTRFVEDIIETERGAERKSEDEDYVSVIIKRTDETVRHPDDALENPVSIP